MVLAAVEDLVKQELPPSEPELETTHRANAAMTNANQQLMEQMTAMMKLMQQQMTLNQPTTTRVRSSANGKEWKYCHTHGFCTHDGTECNNKGSDHKDEATLTNNMNGSQKNVEKYRSWVERQNT